MNNESIHIDLDQVLQIALTGVKRASVFMGLGVNAAINDDFNKYQLSEITSIQLIPDDLSEETVKHFKEEFRLWVEAGGFRELVDTFINYLDSIYESCLLMKTTQERSLLAKLSKRNLDYRKNGLPNKFKELSEFFGVVPFKESYLLSLNRARNCLTHRRGIVGEDDFLHGDSEFTIKWLGLDLFIQEPDGKKHFLYGKQQEGLVLKNGGDVMLGFIERIRTFSRGDKLIFSTRDLAEICWYYEYESKKLLESVICFANTLGIQIKNNVNAQDKI
jgi:hypothetical protein